MVVFFTHKILPLLQQQKQQSTSHSVRVTLKVRERGDMQPHGQHHSTANKKRFTAARRKMYSIPNLNRNGGVCHPENISDCAQQQQQKQQQS